MIKLVVFLSLCFLTVAENDVFQLNVTRGQVFIFDVFKHLNWTENELQAKFRFTLSVSDGPDIPYWLFSKTMCQPKAIYLFGAPPKNSDIKELEIRISVTNWKTFRTLSLKLILHIQEPIDHIKYEIRLRISNFNIVDMLNLKRPNDLIEIFENNFWEDSKGKLYLTFLAGSEDLGFRLPASPTDTAGVVLHLGSRTNFSQKLIDLQNETSPLSKHCPTDFYKRVTVERFFRPKNFAMDWCFFKLVNYDDCSSTSLYDEQTRCNYTPYNFSSSILNSDIEILTEKDKLPNSDVYQMIVALVVVPAILVAFGIMAWLISILCLNFKSLYDPYSDDYFETIFYICEDFRRSSDDSLLDPEYSEKNNPYNAYNLV